MTGQNRLEKNDSAGRKTLLLAASLLLPCLILYFGIVVLGIIPFGDHTLAISDGGGYMTGLPGLGRFIKHPTLSGLLYSLGGLGNNSWAGWAWGGFNIGRVLAVFATLENAPEVFTWVCVLNISLCGLTMYLLLAGIFGYRVENLAFSTSYALMGYNVCYCYHTLFFIGVHMLPLMILGIIWIFRNKSPLLYVISLAICIFCNFYFGFMLCVASVIVFCAMLVMHLDSFRGRVKRLLISYGASSVIAGLLGAAMWLPALKAYSNGGRLTQAALGMFTVSKETPFIQTFSKLFTGASSSNEQIDGLPNIFCGILVVALVVLYFMNREISAKRKRAAGLVLGFYLLSFYIPVLTKLMHGGTHTNWFNYRYSFVFSFFLIMLAAEEFQYINSVTWKDAKRCGIALAVSSIFIFSTEYEFITSTDVLIDFSVLCLLILLLWLYQTKKLFSKNIAVTLLLSLVSINLFANFSISIYKLRDMDLDLSAYYNNLILSGSSVDALKQIDPTFYRMEKDFSESSSSGTDSGLYGYTSVSGSGPTVRQFIHTNASRIGLNWYDMRHWYSEGVTSATDALLGLKYILAIRDLEEWKGYTPFNTNGVQTVYQNPNYLDFAILSNGAAANLTLGNNVFDNLNRIWKSMCGGKEDIFIPEEEVTFTLHNLTEPVSYTAKEMASFTDEALEELPNKAYIEMTFTAKQDGTIYRFDTSVPDSASGSSSPAIKCLGYYKAGDTVIDTSTADADYAPPKDFIQYSRNLVYAYSNDKVLASYAKQLNNRDITFEKVKSTDLTGEFTAEPGQRILFTLPWDEGWTAYIDGQQVPIQKTWDLFMSIEAPEGHHTYEMKFFPAWMNYGLYLSAAAFAGLVILMIVWKKQKPAAVTISRQETQESELPVDLSENQADGARPVDGADSASIVPLK